MKLLNSVPENSEKERLIDIQKYILIQNSKLRITIPSAALTEYNSGIFFLYFGLYF
jgi:hypothetical protein